MNYFKDENGNVFAYDDEQVAMGLADDKTPITEEEAMELTAPPPAPAPLPYDPTTELATPTVAEWNALCEAAGTPELLK